MASGVADSPDSHAHFKPLLGLTRPPPRIEVFYMLFERYLSIFRMTSNKQLIEYCHFRCKIQLDQPVTRISPLFGVRGKGKKKSI